MVMKTLRRTRLGKTRAQFIPLNSAAHVSTQCCPGALLSITKLDFLGFVREHLFREIIEDVPFRLTQNINEIGGAFL